jgi:two-component system, NarL family, sensor histidine kinase DevS
VGRVSGTHRDEVGDLRRELEETNRGLIALYAELEDARAAAARLAAIVQSSDDAMYSMSPAGVIESWNAGAERLLGYVEAAIIGRHVDVLVPERDRGPLQQAMARLLAGERVLPYDTWRRRKDGSLVEVAVTLSAMRDPAGELIGYSAVLRDLTERRRREAELAAAHAAQQVMADRDRIARDLHDLAIQRIFGAGLALQAAASLVTAPELSGRLEAIIRELDATISEIRSMIFGLQYGRQAASSLRAQVQETVARAAHSLGYRPRLSIDGPIDAAVPDAVGEHLLAALRESLSNVARHARASRVEVDVRADQDLVLSVVDDGRGLGPATRRSGLRNLRERAEALGGTFAAGAGEGGGTRLVWSVPLRAGR